jgi:hypothetical protein
MRKPTLVRGTHAEREPIFESADGSLHLFVTFTGTEGRSRVEITICTHTPEGVTKQEGHTLLQELRGGVQCVRIRPAEDVQFLLYTPSVTTPSGTTEPLPSRIVALPAGAAKAILARLPKI